MRKALVWFRRDLRMADNTALYEASKRFELVYPVFVFDPAILSRKDTAPARVAFLLGALQSLRESFRSAGSDLIVRLGDPVTEITSLGKEWQIDAVFWNRDHEPFARRRDAQAAKHFQSHGWIVEEHADSLMHEPEDVLKDNGTPYEVFTPFFKAWQKLPKRKPAPKPNLKPIPNEIASGELPSLQELGFSNAVSIPEPSEMAAQRQLELFLKEKIMRYKSNRDIPSLNGTSRLSIHLRFGTISSRAVYFGAHHALSHRADAAREIECYISELAWREFYRMILWHFPHTEQRCFRPVYDSMEWQNNKEWFEAWCHGLTGYPIVDAGMRELVQTGWIHNRVRMIVASFLTKDLLVSWRWGELFFMRHLLDGDLASNNGGWQWAAGTGTDAQPYFRIFNPASQQAKFDPDLAYIRKWVPELGTASYPEPIVDHATQRAHALQLYQQARGEPFAER